ncbi:hypothetical protein EV426DRAFT_532517 [Tirmania nivea]|nr:hypothetical protein EV426DRAFT_532517 [Tirmania nivea]
MPPPPARRISTSATAAETPRPSVLADLALPPLPLFRALAAQPPGKPAIVDYGPAPHPQPHTYGQLLQSVSLGRARLLERYGNRDNDLHGARVAFLATNSFGWAATLLAIWAAGGVAVPLCAAHPVKEMAYVVGDSGAALALGAAGFLDKLDAVAVAVRRAAPDGALRVGAIEELFDPTPTPPAPLPAKWDVAHLLQKRALIIYTSGTTSLPKGVVTTHLNLSAQAASLVLAWAYAPADHLLHILPLHHVHGILNCTLAPLLAGSTIEFLPQPFSPGHVLARLAQGASGAREQVTLLMAVPAIYTRLLEQYHSAEMAALQRADITRALSALRLAVSGSASLPTSVRSAWAEISAGGTLLERYGMTEVGMAVSCGLDASLRPAGAVGWVLPGYEVGLRPCEEQPPPSPSPSRPPPPAPLTEGEVLVRGPGVFTEYWNRPSAATSQEFLPPSYTPGGPGAVTPPLSPSAYSWFKTGDFARLSPSSSSSTSTGPALSILGRLTTDILKSGSEKLSALEIEHAILQAPLPIAEAAVVGLPSRKWGDLVAAVVVLKPGSAGWSEHRVQRELRAELKKSVVGWKVPKVVRVVPELNKNAMGKVGKRQLVEKVFPGWREEEN